MPATPDFRSVLRFLEASGIRYVIVGGFAAGLLGEARATADVDLVTFLPREDLERFIRFAHKRRIRIPARTIRERAYRDAYFRIKVAGTQVDFIVGESGFEFDILTRSRKTRIYGMSIPVATPEDMILMKLVSGRAIDWADAKAIHVRHGRTLDTDYLEGWARSLKVQRGRGNAITRWRKLRGSLYRR